MGILCSLCVVSSAPRTRVQVGVRPESARAAPRRRPSRGTAAAERLAQPPRVAPHVPDTDMPDALLAIAVGVGARRGKVRRRAAAEAAAAEAKKQAARSPRRRFQAIPEKARAPRKKLPKFERDTGVRRGAEGRAPSRVQRARRRHARDRALQRRDRSACRECRKADEEGGGRLRPESARRAAPKQLAARRGGARAGGYEGGRRGGRSSPRGGRSSRRRALSRGCGRRLRPARVKAAETRPGVASRLQQLAAACGARRPILRRHAFSHCALCAQVGGSSSHVTRLRGGEQESAEVNRISRMAGEGGSAREVGPASGRMTILAANAAFGRHVISAKRLERCSPGRRI